MNSTSASDMLEKENVKEKPFANMISTPNRLRVITLFARQVKKLSRTVKSRFPFIKTLKRFSLRKN